MDSTRRKMKRKNETIVDETFYVWETTYGLWSTKTIEGYQYTLGLTGATRDDVVDMTRWHLKCLQDGTLDDYTRVVGSSVVDGKL